MPRPKIAKNSEELDELKELQPPKNSKPPTFQSVKGMHDILPKDSEAWKSLIETGFHISDLHDFSLIETPILEPASLFEASLGVTTDIIEKQMYVFKTKSGERLALRPEGTAPIMRSYLENHLGYYASPLKVFYYGPMFRYEKPQAGRYRQFHQWSYEIIGVDDPFYDIQIILVFLSFLKSLGIKDLKLVINTVGCKVCRPNYRKKLINFYKNQKKGMCDDCVRRYEKNPMRLLDCKEEKCGIVRKEAPIILDHLCQGCNSHFKGVLELIEDNHIEYEPDPYLVRGLDYYSRTVFEIFSVKNRALALAGGGRYDYLAEILGSRTIPAIGGALGIERIIEYLTDQKITQKTKKKPSVSFVAVGEQAKKSSVALIDKLRDSSIRTLESISKQSLKSQLKMADRARSPITLIYGQKEVFEGSIIVRDMTSGVQETILVDKIVEEVKKRLR